MQKRFHRYNLMTELAKKYSHATYLASPTDEPEHQVVLTIFTASLFHFPNERENLLKKAQNLKDLQHPYLAPILDVGTEKEQPFVVREYFSKESLRSHLKKLSPDHMKLQDALTIVSQVGEAIAYAHEHNIVHGNIKPENIFLDTNGQAILTDFYLISRKDAIIRDQTSEEYAFCYLAPELLSGTCDAQSDQYALGSLAYELITGQVPFAAQSLSSMMGHPSNTVPTPLSEYVADISPSLESAVLKMLAPKPTERFFDFSLFLDVIRSILSPPPPFPLTRSTTLQREKRDLDFSASTSKIPLQLDESTPSLTTMTLLTNEDTNDSFFIDIFNEEPEVSLVKASTGSLDDHNEDMTDKMTISLTNKTVVVHKSLSMWTLQGQHNRRKLLGIGLISSVTLPLLIYAFWSFGISTPHDNSRITYKKSHLIIPQIIVHSTVQPPAITTPTIHPSTQAATTPTAHPTTSNTITPTALPPAPTSTPIPPVSYEAEASGNTIITPAKIGYRIHL